MATIEDLIQVTYQIFLDNGLDPSEQFKPVGQDVTTIGEALIGLLTDLAERKDYADWDTDSWKTAVANLIGGRPAELSPEGNPRVRPAFEQSIDIFDQYDREEAAFVPGAEEGDREYLPWRVFIPPVGGLTVEEAAMLTEHGKTKIFDYPTAKPNAGTTAWALEHDRVAEAAGTTLLEIDKRRVSRGQFCSSESGP